MKSSRLALLATTCALVACSQDRPVASTEVENEVALGRIQTTGSDTAALVGATWIATDSAGTTLGSGTTDSTGTAHGAFRWSAGLGNLLVRFASASDTVRVLLEIPSSFSPHDTLKGSANLLTESVIKAFRKEQASMPGMMSALARGRISMMGDSIVRKIAGVEITYGDVASGTATQSLVARAMLQALSTQVVRSHLPPRQYVEDQCLKAGRAIASDTAFARDLAEGLRRLDLAPDTQSLVAHRLDSLAGRGGALVDAWNSSRFQADSALFAGLLPWIAHTDASQMRADLLDRADRLGHDATHPADSGSSAPPPPEEQMATVRRTALRIWVHLLGDLAAPPSDSTKRNALDRLLRPAEKSFLDAWHSMNQPVWNGRDSLAADFIGTALDTRRQHAWSTSALVNDTDPSGYVTSNWPLPVQKEMRGILDSLAKTKRWGDHDAILLPALEDSVKK